MTARKSPSPSSPHSRAQTGSSRVPAKPFLSIRIRSITQTTTDHFPPQCHAGPARPLARSASDTPDWAFPLPRGRARPLTVSCHPTVAGNHFASVVKTTLTPPGDLSR